MKNYLKQYFEWSLQGICFAIVITSIAICINLVSGCGHNIYLERETTGFRLDIPIGDGTIGFAMGSDKTVRATVRGGASFETSSSNGGGLFSGLGGQSKITQFKSHSQLNEGNLKDVFVSSNVPDAAKMILASNLAAGVNAPYFPGSILQTKESTIHIGRAAIQSNCVEQIQSTEPQGLNRLMDRTASVLGTNVINQGFNTTGNVVHDVVNPFQGTVSEVRGTVSEIKDTVAGVDTTIQNTSDSVKELMWNLILVIVVAILALCLIAILISKFSKKKKSKIVVDAELEDETIPKEQSASSTTAVFPELPAPSQIKDETLVVGKSAKKETKESGESWIKKTGAWIVKAVKLIIRGISMIPPGVRKEIATYVKDWWQERKAAKEAAKKKKAK